MHNPTCRNTLRVCLFIRKTKNRKFLLLYTVIDEIYIKFEQIDENNLYNEKKAKEIDNSSIILISNSDLVDKEEVLKKLEASKAKLEAEIQRSEKMLSNESFISKAPEAKINAEKTKYAEYKAQYDEVIKALKDLK